jgi:hypothetical protein
MLMRRAYGVRGASVPPTWTPPDSANLLIWFDGFTQAEIDAGVLLDRSGNGYNATQTNATKRGTIVDGTGIKGNGTSSSWTLASMNKVISNCTIVAICKPASAQNKQFFALSDYALSNWDFVRLGSCVQLGIRTAEMAIWHDTAQVMLSNLQSYDSTNNYSCVAAVYSLNNAFTWANGNSQLADTSCQFSITTNLPAVSTFLSYGPTYFSDNSIKALLFYSSTLTTNQLSEIQAHYGL